MQIIKSLFRSKRKSEHPVKYAIFLLHLWLGLILGAAIFLICITGALYSFKTEIENFGSRAYLNRSIKANNTVSVNKVIAEFEQKYQLSPSYITIPENDKRNIKVTGGGRGTDAVVAFADRETGEFLGEMPKPYTSFFFTVLKLHRWFHMNNPMVWKQVVGSIILVFMGLLISGLILWWPNNWRNTTKFVVRFKYRFEVWNRDLHINMGAYLIIPLLLIAWTGVCFSFPGVRTATIALFETKDERADRVSNAQARVKASQESSKHGDAKHRDQGKTTSKPNLASIDYASMLKTTDEAYPYKGDIAIVFPGRKSKDLTIRKKNIHNTLGAEVYDYAVFKPNGEYVNTVPFNSRSTAKKVGMLIKSIHTGEVLGLKTKILFFIIALFGAYLPFSGYVLWWRRMVKMK